MQPSWTFAILYALANFFPFATAAAINNDRSTTSSLLSTNITTLGLPNVPIDPHFKISMKLGRSPIDELSCLMVAVDTMADLALQWWPFRIIHFRSKPLPRYPFVFIHMEPGGPNKDIPNRFVIWGLHMAMISYITQRTWVESNVDLVYAGTKVGTLYFRKTVAPPMTAIRPLDPEDQTTGDTLSIVPSPIFLNATNPSRALIEFIPNGQTLNRGSLFLIIFSALQAVAFPITNSFVKETIQIGPDNGRDIRIVFTSTPRKEPPELQYGWVIETLRVLPEWLLSRALREVDVEIRVGNTLVGFGSVEKVGRREDDQTSIS
ncbi:MAG: hypothetical protein Q9218_001837 [Villophora microphyllina]